MCKHDEFYERLKDYEKGWDKSQSELAECLRFTNDLFGYIPENVKEDIAKVFNVKVPLINNLIKLYPSLKAAPYEKEILVCNGSSCCKNGSLSLLKEIETYLGIKSGEVTKDGKYYLSTKKCFKQCGKGPNVKIGNTIHNHMDIEKFKKLY